MKKATYFATKRLYKLAGKTPSKNRTSFFIDEKPVVVIHNPKAAGSTLKSMLGVVGTTHTMPRHAYSNRMWEQTFSIVAVRHPFDRFVSGYVYMIKKKLGGVLRREKGDLLDGLDPFQFLDFIGQYPEKLGQQVNWAHHTSTTKPTADIILKTEDSANWHNVLNDLGLPVTVAAERLNTTRSAEVTPAESLGLDHDEMAQLEEAVYLAYKPDYEAFRYERLTSGK